ncbi:MAG TPA: zinc-regulated TonB-dependent outer membrane receptor [Thermoanaerobaculia bacterium]|nr:zinc-regulated TonB-dependent outer membrane receptor [Thermoanaerobaculia bacterium]
MRIQTGAVAALIGVSLLRAVPLTAQSSDEDLKELEKKIEALRREQAEMQKQLEKLQRDLAARPTPTPTPTPGPTTGEARKAGPVTSPGLTPFPVATWGETGQVTSGTSFNPAISVIAEGLYYTDDRKGGALGVYPQADGFADTGVGGIPDLSKGFNLGETEFTFSAAVDPYFDALAILTVGPGEVGMEEAWIRTRKLLPGLSIKAGRFFSDVGYVNRQHPHQWDFVDQNLPYAMLLAGGINEVGVQVAYLPKTPFYLQIGAEALQGTNPGVANYLGPDENPALSSKAGPRLFTGFLKVSPDVGYSDALQLGVSGGYDTLFQEQVEGVARQGTSWFGGLDAVFKHDDPRPFGQGDLTLQGEFLTRRRSLHAVGEPPEDTDGSRKLKQNGVYFQAVYGLLPRLQLGLRWDTAGLTNQLEAGSLTESFGSTSRFSAALTFNPTEFSRLRAQYEYASIPLNGVRQNGNQFFLQFQVSLGVHGAHRF